MYTVAVWCDGLTATHKSWTLADAKGWLYAYPNKDVFAKDYRCIRSACCGALLPLKPRGGESPPS